MSRSLPEGKAKEPKEISMMARVHRLRGKIKELGSCKQKGCPVKLGKRQSWKDKLRLWCRERDKLGWDWKALESMGDVCTL